MKLLESTRFEAINNALSITTGDSTISGRIESYSCKLAGGDKALYKRFNSEQGNRELQALSPPQTQLGMSPGQGTYSNSCSIAELHWKKLQKIPINFDLRLVSGASEHLLLFNSCCKRIIFIQNIKECCQNEAEPICQYLALSSTIKDCFSRSSWLDTKNNFHYEDVKISNVIGVCILKDTFILARSSEQNVELQIFDRKTKTIVQKRSIKMTQKIDFSKMIIKKISNLINTSNGKTCIYLGFLMLNEKCFKFFIEDTEIIFDDYKSLLNLTNIVDVIFPYNTTDTYYLLSKRSNIYHYSKNKFTKIMCCIHWKAYCVVNNRTFLVSNGRHLYQCTIKDDYKILYNKLNLTLVTSIIFMQHLGVALCTTAHQKFYKIQITESNRTQQVSQSFELDINNIDSTVELWRKIDENTRELEEISKELEKQDAVVKNLAIVSRANILQNHFKQSFKMIKLSQFDDPIWYTEHTCEISSDLKFLLTSSKNGWYYSINYLNSDLQIVNRIFKIHDDKSALKITIPCELQRKDLIVNNNIHKILVDDDCKLGVKINLPKNFADACEFVTLKSSENSERSDIADIHKAIDQIAINSALRLQISSTDNTRILPCANKITYDAIARLFDDKQNVESLMKEADHLTFSVGGNTVKLQIKNNEIHISSDLDEDVGLLTKCLMKKFHDDLSVKIYNSQIRIRLENAIRLLKTEMLRGCIDLSALHEIKRKTRERITSEFINL